jgi:hypothetical protein
MQEMLRKFERVSDVSDLSVVRKVLIENYLNDNSVRSFYKRLLYEQRRSILYSYIIRWLLSLSTKSNITWIEL